MLAYIDKFYYLLCKLDNNYESSDENSDENNDDSDNDNDGNNVSENDSDKEIDLNLTPRNVTKKGKYYLFIISI